MAEPAYYTRIPNMMEDDPRIDAAAFRVYLHYRRRAGEDGYFWKGSREVAKACRMSLETVTKAKATLIDTGYITSEKVRRPDNRWADRIGIVDVWEENAARYSDRTRDEAESVTLSERVTETERTRSDSVTHALLRPNVSVTPSGTDKEKPILKTQAKNPKKEPSLLPSPPKAAPARRRASHPPKEPSETTEVRQAIETLRGGPFPSPAKENKAIKTLLGLGYSAYEIIDCWGLVSKQEFWRTRPLSVVKLGDYMAQYHSGELTKPFPSGNGRRPQGLSPPQQQQQQQQQKQERDPKEYSSGPYSHLIKH